MDVLIPNCAGLDVHQAEIVACALIGPADRRPGKQHARFSTTSQGLRELAAWLNKLAITHVGMEATGVYWVPVYAALEDDGGFEQIVGNAQHIKNVPGRKTDVKDCEWIADLVRHGLVRKSFVPAKPIRVLRDLMRYRRTLVEAQASERSRLIRQLESADIKLASVVSDVFGVTGCAILRALIDGQTDPGVMANLARGHLRNKREALREALDARVQVHQRKILGLQLARVEAAKADIAAIDRDVDELLKPYERQMKRLLKIPGFDRVVAATVIAEIGVDLSTFPSADHLSAWAGVCPGNNTSAGKRGKTPARKGNPHLKTILRNAAISASKKKGSYYKAKYYKFKARMGAGQAALAIAHKLLIAVYNIFTKDVEFRDLGDSYLDRIDIKRTAKRYVERLKKLGYSVVIQPPAPNTQAL